MALAQEQEQKQKIPFARNGVANANAPHMVSKRKNYKSQDSTPNELDTTAAETDKGIVYNLPDGSGVTLDSRHIKKDQTGAAIGITAEGSEKLEMKMKAKQKGSQPEVEEKDKKTVLFKRPNKAANKNRKPEKAIKFNRQQPQPQTPAAQKRADKRQQARFGL